MSLNIRGKDKRNSLAHLVEIIAARSFATLLQIGLLPTPDEFIALVEEVIQQSSWLTGLGASVLQDIFRELSRRASVIAKAEEEYDLNHPPTPAGNVSEGAWVCAPSTGVTEVLKIAGKNVELARIGRSKHEEDSLKVTANVVAPTGLSRSF